MQVRKTVIVTAAVAAIGLGALGATASAQTDSGGTTLVDKIAQQFNLKKKMFRRCLISIRPNAGLRWKLVMRSV